MDAIRLIALVVGAAAGALGVAISMPFGPLQRASRKLRTLRETIDAMDEKRNGAEREVLARTADELAAKIAALHRIPTPYEAYIFGGAMLTTLCAGIGSGFVYGFFPPEMPVAERIFWIVPVWPLTAAALSLTVGRHLYVRDERRRFVERGCPARFSVRLRNDPGRHTGFAPGEVARRHDHRERARRRALEMRERDQIPADWPPYCTRERRRRRIRQLLVGL